MISWSQSYVRLLKLQRQRRRCSRLERFYVREKIFLEFKMRHARVGLGLNFGKTPSEILLNKHPGPMTSKLTNLFVVNALVLAEAPVFDVVVQVVGDGLTHSRHAVRIWDRFNESVSAGIYGQNIIWQEYRFMVHKHAFCGFF
jgi:hypothetical protein